MIHVFCLKVPLQLLLLTATRLPPFTIAIHHYVIHPYTMQAMCWLYFLQSIIMIIRCVCAYSLEHNSITFDMLNKNACMFNGYFYRLSDIIIVKREKGRDLTQSYDISPFTYRKPQKVKWQHKNSTKSSIAQRLRTDLGRSVGLITVIQLVWLNLFTISQPSGINIFIQRSHVLYSASRNDYMIQLDDWLP